MAVLPVFTLIIVMVLEFKFKGKITGQTGDDGTRHLEIMVALRYLSNFWRTLEMPLIGCKIHLTQTWSANCVALPGAVTSQATAFAITGTKLYLAVVTFSSQDHAKLLQQSHQAIKEQLTGININQK